jgi:hypothetical protein
MKVRVASTVVAPQPLPRAEFRRIGGEHAADFDDGIAVLTERRYGKLMMMASLLRTASLPSKSGRPGRATMP